MRVNNFLPVLALIIMAGGHDAHVFSQDKHLFELNNQDFTKELNAERFEWEQEFIAFAKETEKKPENYIRYLLKLMEINGDSHDLITYRGNYMWHFYNYYYEEFKNPSGYLYDKTEVKKSYLQAHISRSPENISRLWGVFGSLVTEIAAPCLVTGKPERKYIQLLVDKWTCIAETKKYQKKLDEIYLKLSEGYYYGDEIWSILKPIMCKSSDSKGTGQFEYESDRTWFYTFWVRRHHEGNAEVTFEILNELLK